MDKHAGMITAIVGAAFLCAVIALAGVLASHEAKLRLECEQRGGVLIIPRSGPATCINRKGII